MKRLLSPGVVLFCLSPMVGELLSGATPPLRFINPISLILEGLLYGGGALRTFSWDCAADGNLRTLRQRAAAAGAPPAFSIVFRLHPVPSSSFPDPRTGEPHRESAHIFESPPLALVEPGDLPGGGRTELVETFDDDRREDPLHTTALWGPPENPGELRGAVGPGGSGAFGAGTADLFLGWNESMGTVMDLYFQVDTDRVVIEQVAIRQTPS